jgi:hypothetical protein
MATKTIVVRIKPEEKELLDLLNKAELDLTHTLNLILKGLNSEITGFMEDPNFSNENWFLLHDEKIKKILLAATFK